MSSWMSRALTALLVLTTGCAASRVPAEHARLGYNQGRAVESVKLKDGSYLVFDAWDTAGPGPDKRARIHDDTIVGYVDGAYRIVNLSDVEELRLGVDDTPETQVAVMTGLALGVTLGVGLAVLIWFVHALSEGGY